MKNAKIIPGQVVPKRNRIATYKAAIKFITGTKNKYDLEPYQGLCLVLPCVLWNLPSIDSDSPSGQYWAMEQVPEMFPEITPQKIAKLNLMRDTNFDSLVGIRIKYLKEAIALCETRKSK